MTTGFSDPVVAAEFRDFIQQQIKTELTKSMEYRYGQVVSISADHKDVTVKFANDATAIKVVLGDTIPRSVGQIVQVLVTDGQYFLTQVMGAGAVQDYVGTEFAAPGWGSPALYSAGSAITVNWSLVANALFYEVQIATNNTFTLNLQSVKTPTPGYTFTNLVADTVYYVRVRAVNSNGAEPGGPWSTTQSITCISASFHYGDITGDSLVPSTSPAAVVTAGIGYLIVNWNAIANADPVTYEVHLSTSSGFIPSDATLCGKTQSTFFFIRTLPPGNTVPLSYGQLYFVRLVATDIDGRSTVNGAQGSGTPAQVNTGDAGQISSGEIISDGQLPASAPTLSPLSAGIGFLLAKWSQVPNSDIVTYDVHISTVTGFTPSANTLIFSTPSTFAFIRNVGPGAGGGVLAYGTTYYVKVLARDADGSGPASAQQSGNILRVATADISDLAITSALVADGAIGTVKITDNAITATKILAGSVTADKLTVGSIGDNALVNGGLEDYAVATTPSGWTTAQSTSGWSPVTGVSSIAGAVSWQTPAMTSAQEASLWQHVDQLIPVTPGDQWFLSTVVKASVAATDGLYFRVEWFTAAKVDLNVFADIVPANSAVGATVSTKSGSVTVPGNAYFMQVRLLWSGPETGGGTSALTVGEIVARHVVTSAIIADGAITTPKIIAGAITAASGIIADAAIGSAKIVDAAITTAKIADAQISTAKIQDLAVSTAKIGNAQITTAKIGDLQVTDGKIASLVANKITVGSLVADITVSARIKTADSGARVELNSSGLKAYDSGGNNTIAVNSDGSGYFSGTVESSVIRTRVTSGGYWAELSPLDIGGSNWPGALKFAENWAWCGQILGGAGGLYFDIPNINQFHLDRIGNSTFVGNWGGRFETWQYSEVIFHDATVYASGYSTGGTLSAGAVWSGSSFYTGNASSGIENTYHNRAIFWWDGYARIVERTNTIHTPIRASGFVVSSARSIKKNIKATKYGLNDLVKLKVYDYDYRENVKDRPIHDSDTGLIADEINEIYPGVVGYDGEGVPVGIDYGRLTPLLIKAIQELNDKVEALA